MQQNKVGEQKSYRLLGLFSLVVLLSYSNILDAQSFAEFKRSQQSSFTHFRDERDNAFKNYLKDEWKAYKLNNSIKAYAKPKPRHITPAIPSKIKSIGPLIYIETPPKKDIPKKKTTIETEKKGLKFDFFGSKITLQIPQKFKEARFYPQNKKGILNFFNTVASSEYNNLLHEIKDISKKLNLNDWGIYLLIQDISQHIQKNHDSANLTTWFLLNKLGYDVRVALANRHTILMHYSKKVIYSTPNYTFNHKRYYVISNYSKGSLGAVYSYKHNYPKAYKPLDLSIKNIPNFPYNIKHKKLTFNDFTTKYTINIKYNQNFIDFLSTYPQADYASYFNAPLDPITYTSLTESLKKYINGEKASDALNFLLHFVQKSFKYEQDFEQFSREKVMFAQETLYFDKSDCEDRAILYSYLVKKILSIDVVGIKYQDHMATALYVPMDGDKVKVGSRELVVADPTYINANIGQSMKKYKYVKPKGFIFLNR